MILFHFLTIFIPLCQSRHQDRGRYCLVESGNPNCEYPGNIDPLDPVLVFPIREAPLEIMFGDDETIKIIKQLIHQSLDKGLTTAIAAITKRQDAMEKRTDEQLDSCRNLLVPLTTSMQERLCAINERPPHTPSLP